MTLLFHPVDVADGLLAMPLYGLLGGDVTYNVVVLFSFVLGGWGAYLLALYLTGSRRAAFVAGLVFVLSPYHFLRLQIGHLNLATVQWIPFYILFLLKFVRQGSRQAAGLAVFFMAFMALHSWYYVIYCGLFSAGVLFWPDGGAWGRRLARVAGVLLASVVVVLPLLVPMFQLLGSTTMVGEHDPLRHSVDGLSFWAPGPPSTWAGWFETVWLPYAAHYREPGASGYLGYSALGLGIIGLMSRRRRRQGWWWLAVGMGFAVLSLGPKLQVGGQVQNINLPYRWLASLIPAFSITGIPGRFVVMAALAVAMLAAYGVSAGLARLKRGQAGLFAALSLLVMLEYLAVPLPLTSTAVEDIYHRLAQDNEPYAIIDIKWDINYLLARQTIHRKPLIGGWLARLPADKAAYLNQGGLDKSLLYLLLEPEQRTLTDASAIQEAIHRALAKRNVRYIIDHNHTAQAWLQQYLGLSPINPSTSDGRVDVYAP